MNTPGGERPVAPATGEQAVSKPALTAEFPRWDIWHGVASLCYAYRRRSSPPVVVRAHNWAALRQRIIAAETTLGRRP